MISSVARVVVPPAPQPLGHRRGDAPRVARDLGGVVLGQPAQVPRRGDGGGPQAAGVLDQPRRQAAHQRDEQQRVDRGEPEAGEHLEGLQPVQPRPDGRMFGDVLLDLGLVEAALRQQRAGNRGQRQQEQQHQRGAHRRQRAPGVADQREQTRRPHTGFRGAFASARGDSAIISAASRRLTNASRTQDTKSFHTPVTSATPTRISSTPPKIWMARV